jgi:leucyl-tRNA synthetase
VVDDDGLHFDVFTTRADTLYGVTFIALAPEHAAIPRLIKGLPTEEEVESFCRDATNKAEIDRASAVGEKSGVFTGRYARNPLSGEDVPIWVADYVLISYGEGAVMGVPAHDQRDFLFARKYGIAVVPVIRPANGDLADESEMTEALEDYGVMENSGPYSGLTTEEGNAKLAEDGPKEGWGQPAVNYHLHDWLISRQRYWGAPIPIIHCPRIRWTSRRRNVRRWRVAASSSRLPAPNAAARRSATPIPWTRTWTRAGTFCGTAMPITTKPLGSPRG